ncbi:MAG: hypothetical protein Q7T93_00765 [Methylobacterium sp.]|uniref:hypothetical protein n=1 Tax=Methylobacterium sp. TaxID=409 RepID=UPI002721B67D|nr:hypothetical protein [Methylobacterium sp.]MDO9425345.1 hypothetical protein [Methylobacterium sp.]
MKAFLIAPALLVSLMTFTPAVAAPAAPLAAAPATESLLLGVQYRQDRDDYRRGDRRSFRAGQRYNDAPRGWRRYDRRPNDWRSRRCGQVGPVWFCP